MSQDRPRSAARKHAGTSKEARLVALGLRVRLRGLGPSCMGTSCGAGGGTEPHCWCRGSAAVELVILAPMLMAFVLFIATLGRLAAAKSEVVSAARGAAQSAVIWPTPAEAVWAAEASASYQLVRHHLTCSAGRVSVNTSDFRPGGVVRVSVVCTMSMAELSFPGMPGSKTVVASVAAPIETYRGIG